jgi:hypothetical protein
VWYIFSADPIQSSQYFEALSFIGPGGSKLTSYGPGGRSLHLYQGIFGGNELSGRMDRLRRNAYHSLSVDGTAD